MIWLQIIVSLFTLVMVFKLFKQKQADKISTANFLIWLLLWLAILLVFWQPNSTSYLANILGIGRGADLVVYLSIIIVFYLLFRIFIRLNKIETDLTRLTREDAINHAKKR